MYGFLIFTVLLGNIAFKFQKNSQSIAIKDITTVWFRRGYLYFRTPYNPNQLEVQNATKEVSRHLKEEITTLKNFLYAQLKTKPSLNHPHNYNMNKLIALEKAKAAGLKIPKTLITQKKSNVLAFQKENGALITKNIQDVMSIDMGWYGAGHATKMVETEELNNADDSFFYSLFQECIDKKYELRIFYLMGKCYTAAIFSQRDEQTSVDYRNYNEAKMNRVVPYSLPDDIACKVDIFMKSVELESGSLDIIVNKKGEYIFLEVNPVGQYDYVGKNCNYNLDKKVAEFLAYPYQNGYQA